MTYFASNLLKEKHCFFGSSGGHSTGFYQGLNVNTRGDDVVQNVAANLSEAAAYFGLKKENLVLLNQEISSDVAYVAEVSQDVLWVDAAVTDQKGVALCIRTADCAPVLLADYANGVIGAAHAGWRGVWAGVIENTIDLMLEKGAKIENIAAAVGPCIGQVSYEVDESFYCQFVDKDPAYRAFFVVGVAGKYLFDLEAFCLNRLQAKGIINITASGLDTYALKDEYYSFRRFTHLNLVKKTKCFPTELSAIIL